MSEKNNIDELFRSKLAGREVGYSAAAWSGAAAMLDSHFKWLFIRRALYILLPIVALSGVGLLYNQTESAAYAERNSTICYEELGDLGHFGTSEIASEMPGTELHGISSTKSVSKTNAHAKASKGPINVVSTSTSESQDQDIVSNERAVKPESEITQSTIEPSSPSIIETNSTGTLGFEEDINPFKHPSVSTELASLKLKSNIGLMPIASFDHEYDLSNNLRDKETPLLSELRKIQLFAEGGALLATNMDRVNSNIPGVGLHARLLLKYHLGESVYLDFGVGGFNRNALPDGKPFGGSGTAASVVQINPTWISYGAILLGTGYRIGARHALGIGFEFNPLLMVQAKRIETILGETNASETRIIDNTGISTFDAAFVANYRFSIAERLDATSEVHFGFIDATDNNVFDASAGANNNTLLKLGLSYRLTNR